MDALEKLFTTSPHGAHEVYLVEDHQEPEQRIYEIHDRHGHATPLLGSELGSLCEWWTREQERDA